MLPVARRFRVVGQAYTLKARHAGWRPLARRPAAQAVSGSASGSAGVALAFTGRSASGNFKLKFNNEGFLESSFQLEVKSESTLKFKLLRFTGTATGTGSLSGAPGALRRRRGAGPRRRQRRRLSVLLV